MKKCARCNELKPLDDFGPDKRMILGKCCYCKECARAKGREWRNKNKEKGRAWSKEWRKNNPERAKELTRAWIRSHRDRMNDLKRKGEERRGIVKVKLEKRMRQQIYRALRGGKNRVSWADIVGYSAEDLKRHIEKRFSDGMNWDNIGDWHIDHIIPVAAFNFTCADDIDFKKCFALDNLRPLWGAENSAKRDKVDRPFQPSLAMPL